MSAIALAFFIGATLPGCCKRDVVMLPVLGEGVGCILWDPHAADPREALKIISPVRTERIELDEEQQKAISGLWRKISRRGDGDRFNALLYCLRTPKP